MYRGTRRARVAATLALVSTGALALALWSSTSGASAPAPRKVAPAVVSGGTAYFAEQPETPPNYIFPLVSGAYFTARTRRISRRCSTSRSTGSATKGALRSTTSSRSAMPPSTAMGTGSSRSRSSTTSGRTARQ